LAGRGWGGFFIPPLDCFLTGRGIMMHLKVTVSVVVILGLIFAGCIDVLYNVKDAPIPKINGRSLSLEEVKKAIMRTSGTSVAKYKMVDVEPGLIRCELTIKSAHKAWAEIPYSEKGYSILYQKSVNLRYAPAPEGGSESISRHYNKWIRALNISIQEELGKVSSQEEIERVSSSEPAVTDVESRLLQLKRLRESGLISEDEFSRKRGEILNSL
jgi:hypothetical protein